MHALREDERARESVRALVESAPDLDGEQFLFAPATLDFVATLIPKKHRVLALLCPLVFLDLARRGFDVRGVDRDARLDAIEGFSRYTLGDPIPRLPAFDWIVCDPPFFTLPPDRFAAHLAAWLDETLHPDLLLFYLDSRIRRIEEIFGRAFRRLDHEVRYLEENPIADREVGCYLLRGDSPE